jgi:Domain of unknown function (DUF4265)
MTEPPLVKIKVSLPPNDPSGMDAEWLWGKPVGDASFALQNVPFLIDGLSCEDVVAVRLEDDIFVFDRVLSRSGHSTYRIYAKVDKTDSELNALIEKLRSMHCEFERANSKLLGVNVLPEADIYAVYKVLEDAENLGFMEFDEGHCGHAINPES